MHTSRGLKAVVVGLLIVTCGAVALCAAELHVPADYESIQEAVTAAVTGDTIIVAAGEYGGVSIGDKTGITIRGEAGAVIRGRIVVNNCSDLTIEGFQITSPKEGILVMGLIDGLTLRNNDIVNCGTHGITFKEGSTYSDVLIEGNNISGNGYDGIQLLGTTGDPAVEGDPTITIRGNKINNNGRASSTGVGIRVGANTTGGLIEDNTITGNSFAGIHPA